MSLFDHQKGPIIRQDRYVDHPIRRQARLWRWAYRVNIAVLVALLAACVAARLPLGW